MSKIVWTSQRTINLTGSWLDLKIATIMEQMGWFRKNKIHYNLVIVENRYPHTSTIFQGNTIEYVLFSSSNYQDVASEYRHVQYQLGIRSIADVLEDISGNLAYSMTSVNPEEREIAIALHGILNRNDDII